MTSFHTISNYNPILILIIGLTNALGWIGMGRVLLAFLGIRFTQPWMQVASAITGIIISGCLIFFLAAMKSININSMILWFGLLAGFAIFNLYRWKEWKIAGFPGNPEIFSTIALAFIGVTAFINLIAAMAPSTKIDELYYHMILPARIAQDGGFEIYRLPWESAVWPQMIYQVALVPLYVIGFPDAGNVTSWFLNLMLIWFGISLLPEKGKQNSTILFVILTFITGLYPVIWDTTNGPYAFSELATAAVTVLVLSIDPWSISEKRWSVSMLISLLLIGMAFTKIIMLPLAVLMLLICMFRILTLSDSRRTGILHFTGLSLPWILLYLPILYYTCLKTGSAFGPVFPGLTGGKYLWNPDWIKSIFHIDHLKNAVTTNVLVTNLCIYFPPLFWISAILFFFSRKIPAFIRIAGFFLFSSHALVLFFQVIFDPRYYGGFLHGLIILFLLYQSSEIWFSRKNKVIQILLIAGLLPWTGLQFYYGSQYFGIVSGLTPKEKFCSEMIAMFDDYLKIDKILPGTAVFLINGDNTVRMNSVYLPRPVCYHAEDLPKHKQVFLLSVNRDAPVRIGCYITGKCLYRNPMAKTIVFRDRMRDPVFGTISVHSLSGSP